MPNIEFTGLRREIAQAKITHGWKQREIAEKCDINESRLSLIANGKAQPTYPELARFAALFSAEIQNLVEVIA